VLRLQREIRRKAVAYGILAVLMAVTLGVICFNFGIRFLIPPVSASTLRTFSSQEELENYLTTSQKSPYYKLEVSGSPRILLPFGATPSPVYLATLGGVDVNTVVPRSGPEYSVTNIQVAGVDEADIVKTDGEYMYIISGNNVTILKAYPAEEAQVLSQISLNGTLRGIFINGDKMAVFGESHFYQAVEAFNVTVKIVSTANETIPLPVEQVRIDVYNPMYLAGCEAFIKVYNITNRLNPLLTREVALNGSCFSSRMIGDYVYAVTSQPTMWYNSRVLLPTIIFQNETRTIQPTEIYYSNVSDNSYAFTTIVAVNIKLDDTEPVHQTYLLGSASNMYASLNNIYITMIKQVNFDTSWTETTLIYRVHIQEEKIKVEASGEVPGRVLNQFSMDEYNEYFRIATTTGEVWSLENPSKNDLYVLDMNLTITGRLENLAFTERIYSARFMGNRCYLVTFRQIDPLFVIDLSTPSEPRVLGELEITGYSDYLHPYDENHIIGIGKETIEDESGDFAWYQGVKISLFDVSDVANPREIDKYVIGDRGTESPVLHDHKAFLFDRLKGLLVIPVSVAEINEAQYPGGYPPWTYGEFVFQGAYVFNITLSGGLVLKGRITHLDALGQNGQYYGSPYYVYRSLYIDNVLYTISANKVKMNDLETLTEINEIELP